MVIFLILEIDVFLVIDIKLQFTAHVHELCTILITYVYTT